MLGATSPTTQGPGDTVAPVPGPTGEIDYRLARRSRINAFKKGRLSRHDVCDAHPDLVRAARNVG